MLTRSDGRGLAGRRVLIVEDEWSLAQETAEAAVRAGCTVLGPVPDAAGALAIVAETPIDAAILDIRIGEQTSFPIASFLEAKGVQVVFVTGYDDWYLTGDLDDVPIYRKSIDPDNVVRILFQKKPGDMV